MKKFYPIYFLYYLTFPFLFDLNGWETFGRSEASLKLGIQYYKQIYFVTLLLSRSSKRNYLMSLFAVLFVSPWTSTSCARDKARWKARRKWLVCSRCHATMGPRERKEGGAAMRVTVTIVANGISQTRAMPIDTRRSIARMHMESRKRIIYTRACEKNIARSNRAAVISCDPRLNGSFHRVCSKLKTGCS